MCLRDGAVFHQSLSYSIKTSLSQRVLVFILIRLERIYEGLVTSRDSSQEMAAVSRAVESDPDS
jgi:hypothetical protein